MFSFFLRTLFGNLFKVFSRRNLPLHLVAIFLTYLLVISNFDFVYFKAVRNTFLLTLFFPAIIIGAFVPLLLPLILIVYSALTKRRRALFSGFALGQAALIGSCVSSLYKAFTGRFQPNTHDTLHNISNSFHFGFLKHGIFWGWPSSHTTIAFAMATTLAVLIIELNKKYTKILVSLSLLYAFYIGVGVSLSIHWFSDFVAGAIFGSLIGLIVGKSFAQHFLFTEKK